MVPIIPLILFIAGCISVAINIKLYFGLRSYRVFTDILLTRLMELDPEGYEEEEFEAEIIPFRGKPDKEDP
jgi:hypothetical protein